MHEGSSTCTGRKEGVSVTFAALGCVVCSLCPPSGIPCLKCTKAAQRAQGAKWALVLRSLRSAVSYAVFVRRPAFRASNARGQLNVHRAQSGPSCYVRCARLFCVQSLSRWSCSSCFKPTSASLAVTQRRGSLCLTTALLAAPQMHGAKCARRSPLAEQGCMGGSSFKLLKARLDHLQSFPARSRSLLARLLQSCAALLG